MKRCSCCHGPFGLLTGRGRLKNRPRHLDFRVFPPVWRVFHDRECKREWLHKRKVERQRERAISTLYQQHHPP